MPLASQTSKCTRCRNHRSDFDIGVRTCNRCREDKARYQRTETGREKQQVAKNKWRSGTDHGLRLVAAHSAVYSALKSRKLSKQPCEVCGAINVHAHHPDYDKALEVRWLCHKHHLEVHRVTLG